MSEAPKTPESKKIAVILFNLGGPDRAESVRPFLFNFFMDKNIIRLPLPGRFFLASLIAWRRSKKEAGESYAALGGRSPLLENTQAQAAALETALNADKAANYRVFVCMRYWHPMTKAVAAAVRGFDPAHIVLLPLYPQYSTTTTRSSFQQWQQKAREVGLKAPVSGICCYPRAEGYVAASADNIRRVYHDLAQKAVAKNLPAPRVLFSAHGLPEDIIRDGDPYQWQCEKSAEAIVQNTGLENLDWEICYQSRVGPKKWIGPSAEEALKKAGRDGVPVLMYPHAFVNEHVETLVEIEIEYREFAAAQGVPLFARVPTVATHKEFIAGLAALVKKARDRDFIFPANEGQRCPVSYKRCCQKDKSVCG